MVGVIALINKQIQRTYYPTKDIIKKTRTY